jgi:hypothetical protein
MAKEKSAAEMHFFEFIIDALTWCLWCLYDEHEEEWNVRRIVWALVIVVAITLVGYGLHR